MNEIRNTKQLRKWLEDRGVAVVGTRTRRDGALTATSCNFYGPGKAHCFRTHPDWSVVTGSHVAVDGKERDVQTWDIQDNETIRRSEVV